MATQRFQLALGGRAQDVVVSAGSAVASETVQVNFDFTNMTKGDALLALDYIKERVSEGPWPPA
jgi:hypothetical protein